jgi:hypothetical protein
VPPKPVETEFWSVNEEKLLPSEEGTITMLVMVEVIKI